VFDAATGALLSQFQVGQAGSIGVVFGLSPDGSRILMLTNYNDNENLIEVWNIATASRLSRLIIADMGFNSIFAPDGNNLITYASNNDLNLIRWWNPVTGLTTQQLDGQNGALTGILFTPDQKYLLTWGQDETVKIHELASGKLVRTLTPAAQINSVIVSPDGKTIAVSLATFQTTLYSFVDGKEQVTLPGSSIVFLPDRPAVLNTTPDDSTVYAFTLDNSDLVRLACERLKNIASSNGTISSQLKICQENGK
jgi:WD40 repeat protein